MCLLLHMQVHSIIKHVAEVTDSNLEVCARERLHAQQKQGVKWNREGMKGSS